jgi:hypothetical protein
MISSVFSWTPFSLSVHVRIIYPGDNSSFRAGDETNIPFPVFCVDLLSSAGISKNTELTRSRFLSPMMCYDLRSYKCHMRLGQYLENMKIVQILVETSDSSAEKRINSILMPTK